MGFSSEAIFMKPAISEEEEPGLLKKLGLDDLVICQKAPFEETMTHFKRRGVYIGHCGDCSYIVFDSVLVNYFGIVTDKLNPWEQILSDIYPDKDFLSILNYDNTNAYSYHYFREGMTNRKKMGFHPTIHADIGEELELEKEYYVKKESVDGKEIFFTKPWNEQKTELDEWTHDQIGGSVAFHLVKMMAGVEYGHDLMFESYINQYLSEDALEIGGWDLDKRLFKKYPALVPREIIGLRIFDERRYEPTGVSKFVPSKLIGLKNVDERKYEPNDDSEVAKQVPRTPIHINYPSGFHPEENNFASIITVELDQYTQRVWEVLINIKEWDEWFPQIYNTRIVSTHTGQLKPSSRFRWNTLGVHLVSHVIDFESPRKISWSSKGWGITTFHAWQIMPTDSGSKITLEHTQKGWLSQLLHFFLPKRMEKYHLEWLECLQKKLQENP